jgi:hypothetical protein
MSKYEDIHVTIYNGWMLRQIEAGLNPELLTTHSATALVRLDDGRWILRLEYDLMKATAQGKGEDR